MVTLGIDLSSQRKCTVGSLIEWNGKRAHVRAPRLRCLDSAFDAQIQEADVVGIDAPFGWPREFEAAVARWMFTAWDVEIRDRLRFRETDRFVRQQTGLNPLSVSTDLISLLAMRAMALLQSHGVTDRSGDGRFFEVYPVASLHQWGIPHRGYKDAKRSACAETRSTILASLRAKLPWLECGDEYAASSDALDALVASLTARTAANGLIERATPEQMFAVRRQGWIQVPSDWPRV